MKNGKYFIVLFKNKKLININSVKSDNSTLVKMINDRFNRQKKKLISNAAKIFAPKNRLKLLSTNVSINAGWWLTPSRAPACVQKPPNSVLKNQFPP